MIHRLRNKLLATVHFCLMDDGYCMVKCMVNYRVNDGLIAVLSAVFSASGVGIAVDFC